MEEFVQILDELRDSRNLKKLLGKHKNGVKMVSQYELDAMADILSKVYTRLPSLMLVNQSFEMAVQKSRPVWRFAILSICCI